MANPFFSGRIPQDLKDRIDQHRAETGESTTDVLINALSAYVNHPVIRPSADVASPKAEERFKAMDERLAALELSFKRFSLENTVISFDNEKKIQPQDTSTDDIGSSDSKISDAKFTNAKLIDAEFTDAEFIKILNTDINDNNFDNKLDNSNKETKEVLEPVQPIQKPSDNNFDNSDNNLERTFQPVQDLLTETIHKAFEHLASAELIAATGLTRNQVDSYKKKVKAKYKALEQPLEDNKPVESPEKIETVKPIMIHGYPYDLFYLGQNESGNNLWSAFPYDNNRYQQLSLHSQISEQVSTDLA